MMKTCKKIVIAGAGASGMMAAAAAARKLGSGEDILIIEKNEKAGRKLLAAGNGRCNFTNVKCTAKDFSGGFLKGSEHRGFLESVLYQAPPNRVMEEFSQMGILPREEEEGRVYPYSGQGASVCRAMLFELKRQRVEVKYKSALKGIACNDGGFRLTLEDGAQILCGCLILAVGGKAGCQYGSEGDGYHLVKDLGHTVVKPIPALVQLLSDQKSLAELKGIRARAAVALYEGDQKIKGDRGEVQFTESGLSGICVFNLSRYLRYTGNPADGKERYHAVIDFMEDYGEEDVLAQLRARKDSIGDREASAFLEGILHDRLGAALIGRAHIPKETKTSALNEKQLLALTHELKHFDVPIVGTKSWKEAQVTAGGVDTAEIEGKTMESKLVSGLFFTGELIDVDAPCGGYNLQWAFASGMVAGRAAACKY